MSLTVNIILLIKIITSAIVSLSHYKQCLGYYIYHPKIILGDRKNNSKSKLKKRRSQLRPFNKLKKKKNMYETKRIFQ